MEVNRWNNRRFKLRYLTEKEQELYDKDLENAFGQDVEIDMSEIPLIKSEGKNAKKYKCISVDKYNNMKSKSNAWRSLIDKIESNDSMKKEFDIVSEKLSEDGCNSHWIHIYEFIEHLLEYKFIYEELK